MTNLSHNKHPQTSNLPIFNGLMTGPFVTNNGSLAPFNGYSYPVCFVASYPEYHHYYPSVMPNYCNTQSTYNYPMPYPHVHHKHIPNNARKSTASRLEAKPFQDPTNTQLGTHHAAEEHNKEEAINASSSSTEHEAARCIQSWYRGYAVRRCDSLKKLRQLAQVRERLPEIRRQVEDVEMTFDEKKIIYVGEQIMKQLLQLDAVQNLHESVRDRRKCLAKELLRLQEKLDSMKGIPKEERECIQYEGKDKVESKIYDEMDSFKVHLRYEGEDNVDSETDEEGKLGKENEKLRVMVDDLLQVGVQCVSMITRLSERVEFLEKKLGKRKIKLKHPKTRF